MNTTTERFESPWNLVTRHLHGHELLGKKIRQRINKLARHMSQFPPGTAHLHIALERHPAASFTPPG